MTPVINLVQQHDLNQMPQSKLKVNRFYFIENQGWFFYCRNGKRGPFETKPLAKLALSTHIKEQK